MLFFLKAGEIDDEVVDEVANKDDNKSGCDSSKTDNLEILSGIETLAKKTFEGLANLTSLDLIGNELAHLDIKPF
jgi:hypothetical protein